MKPLKIYTLFICVLFLLCISINTSADDSSFEKITYNNEISIEVPKNWYVLTNNQKKNLNDTSEATFKLNNVEINQGNNIIIYAANNVHNNHTVATIRLSVRRVKSATQADMMQLMRLSRSELKEALTPFIKQTKKAIMSFPDIKKVNFIEAKMVSNSSLICNYVEYEIISKKETKLSQSYICPIEDKIIKFTTSYTKNAKTLMQPILQYSWKTLKLSY